MTSDEFDIFKISPTKKSDTPAITETLSVTAQQPEQHVSAIGRLEASVPTILIIDDDFNVRDSLAFAFEQDYQLIFCSSGEEGIAKASVEVATVILDIKMQGKDGFETFTEIKQKFSHLPIIFHSAFQNLKDPYEIMNEFHPFGYISKQGGIQELSTIVASAVEYHFQIRKNALLVGELQQLNNQLEEKVAEKTQNLQQAVDELVDKNAALVTARAEALAAADSKAMFLANMSHEIRTPMNAVLSMAELLMDTPLNAEQRDWLKIVLSSGESLLNLINDILDFSKIEAGKLDLEEAEFELHACVESSLDLLSIRAAQSQLSLSYAIAPDVPNCLRGDSIRLRQILLNLLSNALKFTEQGEVDVSVSCLDYDRQAHMATLQFAVRDTGIGIPAETLTKLFQAFTQAERATTRKYGGTGLGLTISKCLSELMQGKIWAESILGEGSCFYFTVRLPFVNTQPATALEQPHFVNKQVLLCSDTPHSAEHIRQLLVGWRCQATVIDSVALAERMAQQRWDCILIDPGYNSFSTQSLLHICQQCAERQQNVILLLDRTQRKDFNDFNVCIKPLRPSHLYDSLNNLFHTQENAVPVMTTTHQTSTTVTTRTQTQGLRILLADDNQVNQKVANLRLRKLGYHADIANNGVEVLAALQQQTYDVILMDVQMPEMDGITATEQIRQTYSKAQLYIIAMTASAMESDKDACYRAGMNDYVSKPIREDDLRAALVRAAQQST